MALTVSEIRDSLLVLGLPVRTDVTFGLGGGDAPILRRTEIARTALGRADATQEAKIRQLLAEWAKVEFDTDRITAEGLDSNPSRTRHLLRKRMFFALGMGVQFPGGGIRLERA